MEYAYDSCMDSFPKTHGEKMKPQKAVRQLGAPEAMSSKPWVPRLLQWLRLLLRTCQRLLWRLKVQQGRQALGRHQKRNGG